MTPFLGLINLPEWLTELRKTVCSLDYQFIIKGCNSGTARWKRCIGQGMWEGAELSVTSLGAPPSQRTPRIYQPGSCLNPALLGFYGGFTM